MHIGKVIREIRKKKGLSQEDLADKCGLTQSTVSNIETQKKCPLPKNFSKICKELETPETFIYLLATEEKDIPKNKKAIYKMLFPTIENMLKQIIGAA